LLPSSRRGALVRFAVGSLIVILFTAATTAVAGLLQFKQLATDLSVTPALRHANVAVASPGKPQTLLLIGSDHRAGEPWKTANTDTMMLVRLNASSKTINLLSVPRDLRVDIPEGGVRVSDRLNAAYSIGGPNLLVRVISRQVFPGIHINHIIDVNFGGFRALVNTIGCVYVDVDHRYYNNTVYTDYSSIDIQPGYQRLCGADALAFVRFRHTDSDLVRNARQQDFLRWVKAQFSSSYLFDNRNRLLRVFGAHTQTDRDLHSVDGLINLFNLVAFSAGHTVKQIPFPATFLPCGTQPGAIPGAPCYVTSNSASERRAFRQFITPTSSPGHSGSRGSGRRSHRHRSAPPPANVSLDPADGQAQVAALPRPHMPVYYPRVIAPGSSYCLGSAGNCPLEIASPSSYPRAYTIRDRAGRRHAAYRMTLVLNAVLGEYYGVQGTTWRQPPILGSPTATRVVKGRKLQLYSNAGKLSLVAWRTRRAVYWVSNTLTDTLSPRQMLTIAASLKRG
jgi:polyisoprenyl-teichoic acid--peptidoglycan teichoic acid transferase